MEDEPLSDICCDSMEGNHQLNEEKKRAWQLSWAKKKTFVLLMPTHCTIMRFGFRSRRIDGVKCGLFSNHTPLGQTTLRVGRVSV